jgi:hypothetical protein
VTVTCASGKLPVQTSCRDKTPALASTVVSAAPMTATWLRRDVSFIVKLLPPALALATERRCLAKPGRAV